MRRFKEAKLSILLTIGDIFILLLHAPNKIVFIKIQATFTNSRLLLYRPSNFPLLRKKKIFGITLSVTWFRLWVMSKIELLDGINIRWLFPASPMVKRVLCLSVVLKMNGNRVGKTVPYEISPTTLHSWNNSRRSWDHWERCWRRKDRFLQW